MSLFLLVFHWFFTVIFSLYTLLLFTLLHHFSHWQMHSVMVFTSSFTFSPIPRISSSLIMYSCIKKTGSVLVMYILYSSEFSTSITITARTDRIISTNPGFLILFCTCLCCCFLFVVAHSVSQGRLSSYCFHHLLSSSPRTDFATFSPFPASPSFSLISQIIFALFCSLLLLQSSCSDLSSLPYLFCISY